MGNFKIGNFANTWNYTFVLNENPEIYIDSTLTLKAVKEQETKEQIIEGLESLLRLWEK